MSAAVGSLPSQYIYRRANTSSVIEFLLRLFVWFSYKAWWLAVGVIGGLVFEMAPDGGGRGWKGVEGEVRGEGRLEFCVVYMYEV